MCGTTDPLPTTAAPMDVLAAAGDSTAGKAAAKNNKPTDSSSPPNVPGTTFSKIDDYFTSIGDAQKVWNVVKKDNQQLMEENQKLKQDIFILTKSSQVLIKEKQATTLSRAEIQIDLVHLKNTNRVMQQENDDLQKKLKETESIVAEVTKAKNDKDVAYYQMSTAFQDLTVQKETLEKQYQESKVDRKGLGEKYEFLSGEKKTLDLALARISVEKKVLEEKSRGLERKYDLLKTEKETQDGVVEELRADKASAEEQIEKLKKQLEEQAKTNEELSQDIKVKTRKLDAVMNTLTTGPTEWLCGSGTTLE